MSNKQPQRQFYCREWVFNKLCYYMDAQWPARTGLTTSASGCIIYGGAGCGKTTVCREIALPSVSGINNKQNELNQRLLTAHFRNVDILYENAPKTSGADFVYDLIDSCLKCKFLGNYSNIVQSDPHLQNLASSKTLCAKKPLEALIKLLVEPLNKLSPQPSRTLCLIIDTVDNDVILDDSGLQSRHKCAEILQWLAKIYKHLPPWLYFIFTSRKICKTLKKMFFNFNQICLDDLCRSTVIWDIQQYILQRLDDDDNLRTQLNLETAESLNHLHIKSNGCILYLKIVLDSARNYHQKAHNRNSALKFISLKEIQHIPSTLNGLYMWLCQRLIEKSNLKIVKTLFQILLASTRPMTLNDLYQCVRLSDISLTKNRFCQLITLLNSLLIIDQSDQSCSILHYSFAEWLLDVKYCTPKFLCDLRFGHSYISLWYASRSRDLDESEIIDFAYHLTCSSKSNLSSWFDENRENLAPLACFLLQCHTRVQSLILKSKAVNDRTTRLLLDAGADFVSLEDLEDEITSTNDQDNISTTVIYAGQEGTNSIQSCLNDPLLSSDDLTLDRDGRTALHRCAVDGDSSGLDVLLRRDGAFCDAEDHDGNTALILASRHGHATSAQLLLDNGADANKLNNAGWTPLRSAAWGGHTSVVRLLLEHGAQVDSASLDGRTALRAASWGGHLQTVVLLIETGADVNRADADGRTPLIAAAYMGHNVIVEKLLDSGAEIDHQDKDCRTALNVTCLCSASAIDHYETANLLLKRGALPCAQDSSGRTPLIHAASQGRLDLCRLLLSYASDTRAMVDIGDDQQFTALLAAAAAGHVEILNMLLAKGAQLDSIDAEGRTAMTVAAAYGSVEVVKVLMEKGLDEMHRDNNGWIPLHHAAYEGKKEVCSLLYTLNPKTAECTDHDGRHPFLLAAEEGHLDVVEFFLGTAHKFDKFKKSLNGWDALYAAAVNGHAEVCRRLMSDKFDPNIVDLDGAPLLSTAIYKNKLEIVEILIQNGARMDAKDCNGRTPLHIACWAGNTMIGRLLLDKNADVNAKDSNGLTPLAIAVWCGQKSIIELLLASSTTVDVDSKTSEGATAICIAAQQGHEEVVKLLLQHHASIDIADDYGRTPIIVARRSGHDNVCQILLDHQTTTAGHQMIGNAATNTALSNNSSSINTKTSGVFSMSQALYSSLESPYNTLPTTHEASDQTTVVPLSPKTNVNNCNEASIDFSKLLLEKSTAKTTTKNLIKKSSNFDRWSKNMDLCWSKVENNDNNNNMGEQFLDSEDEKRLNALAVEVCQAMGEKYLNMDSEGDNEPYYDNVRKYDQVSGTKDAGGNFTKNRRSNIATNPHFRMNTSATRSLHNDSTIIGVGDAFL